MVFPSPDDDRTHATRENHLVEWWQFEAWSTGSRLGVWVQFGWAAALSSGWYCAVVTAPEGPVVLVVDPDLPLARLTPSLELRAEGIWAHHVCEAPSEHWTVGLEAFGVALDDPADAMGNQWGTRTAVGLDLEWEAVAPAESAVAGLTQDCAVHGEVLLDDQAVDFAGHGRRVHGWGSVLAMSDPLPVGGLEIPVRVERPGGAVVLRLGLDPTGRWSARHG